MLLRLIFCVINLNYRHCTRTYYRCFIVRSLSDIIWTKLASNSLLLSGSVAWYIHLLSCILLVFGIQLDSMDACCNLVFFMKIFQFTLIILFNFIRIFQEKRIRNFASLLKILDKAINWLSGWFSGVLMIVGSTELYLKLYWSFANIYWLSKWTISGFCKSLDVFQNDLVLKTILQW